jgi:hypothetical protein
MQFLLEMTSDPIRQQVLKVRAEVLGLQLALLDEEGD